MFTKRLRDGVRSIAHRPNGPLCAFEEDITCSVRFYTRLHVRVGNRYRMDEGQIEIDSSSPSGCLTSLRNWRARPGSWV
jgi:hypothetical protein